MAEKRFLFDPVQMVSVAREASTDAGLSATRVELLRLGQNLMYLLPGEGVVVRIARNSDFLATAVKEVAVAGWLRRQGFAAAEALAVDQPRVVQGYPVTFWRYVPGRVSDESDLALLGAQLLRFHNLGWPASLAVPDFDPLAQLRQRVESASIPAEDREFLLQELLRLGIELREVRYELPSGVNHGDAHIKNVIVTSAGEGVLLDFEGVCRGPREWDLAKVATEAELGMVSSHHYEAFVRAYGYDVRKWEGFGVVSSVMRLRMTAWIAQNVEHSDAVAQEFAKRIKTLRDGQPSEAWRGF